MNFSGLNFKRILKGIGDFVKPEVPGATPHTMATALALTERNAFSGLYTYRFFDSDLKVCYLDDSDTPAVGFVLAITPLLMAGVDTENQIEAVINAVPADAVVTFGKLVTPQVEGFLNVWSNARLTNNKNPLLRQIAERRKDFM